ncbi:hypothetical protein OGZ33_01840 [Lactococcus lactis]|uniref:hypothetical protein n=1 Tax=Lactococcus lactis TaxID=1358 RepID=UPI00241881C3|nr:hypothetical protein [Lactococcus lactis]MDG4962981.1 hypothetical protein [Lactococcus lactis]
MKLSEIEAVSPEDFVVFDKEDGMPYSYVIDRWYKTGAKEVDDFPKFYTAEQMQEYAKAKILEALGKYGVRDDEWSDHEVDLAHKQMTKFIFEEDTKND